MDFTIKSQFPIHECVAITSSNIKEWLCLYHSSEIYLENIFYSKGMLLAEVSPHKALYSIVDVNYYTAVQITMIASQMGYLISASAILNNYISNIPPHYYTIFIDKLKKSQIYYTNISIKFHKKSNNNISCNALMKIEKVKVMKNLIVAHYYINFNDSASEIYLTFAMPL